MKDFNSHLFIIVTIVLYLLFGLSYVVAFGFCCNNIPYKVSKLFFLVFCFPFVHFLSFLVKQPDIALFLLGSLLDCAIYSCLIERIIYLAKTRNRKC